MMQLPLFYRLPRPLIAGETRRIVPESPAELATLVKFHGKQMVVCPRFSSADKSDRNIQGIPIMECVLCDVSASNGGIEFQATQAVDVISILDDTDTVENMIVDAVVECWKSEGEDAYKG